jgi:hypothetical protein
MSRLSDVVNAAAGAVSPLTGRRLDLVVEVRDADTGEMLYTFQAADDVREGDEVVIRHRIGVQVSES